MRKPLKLIGINLSETGKSLSPCSSVNTIRVVSCRLFGGIKITGRSWVIPKPWKIEPVPVVTARIIVYQLLFEPFCTSSPFKSKIIHQVRSHILSATIAHPASFAQLIHIGINKRVGSPTIFPRDKEAFCIFWFMDWGSFRVNAARMKNFSSVKSCRKLEKITPQQFKYKPICAFIWSVLRFIFFNFPVNFPRGKTSNWYPWWKTGREIWATELISSLFIFRNTTLPPYPIL